ncbi:MAG: hypothetical protein JWR88_81 [Pseudonocardia sp.]|jgi:hypothetical protein|nr:hypothetical protein [Pseudonocardia sp.]
MHTVATWPEPATTEAPDRCDRCSAAAKFEAVFPAGFALHFCGHHAHEHEAKLREQDVELREVA